MPRLVLWLLIATIAIGILVATLIASGGSPVQIAIAEQSDIRESVDQEAQTRLPRTHRITMPFASRLNEIELVEGQAVEQGEVVCQVVMRDLDNELAEAQAAVDRLSRSIDESQDVSVEQSTHAQALSFVESMVNTVAAADARAEAGKAQLKFATERLERIRQLGSSGATSQDEIDRAQLEYEQSLSSFRQDSLTSEAVRSIEAATKLLPRMVQDFISRKELGTKVLLKQKDEAEARLRQIELRKQRGTMTSPIQGVVLSRAIKNEQFVQAGTELLTLGDLSLIELESEVLSQDAVRIRVGQEARVYGVALALPMESGLSARVSRIFPAGFTKVSSLGVEQQRVKVVIELDEAAQDFLLEHQVGIDYQLRARIFTATAIDAIVLPRSCIFRGPTNQWQVFVVEGHRAQLRNVEVGIMNDDQVQITDGLALGAAVIAAPENSIMHGTKVRPISP
ncbi:efflux RND transporter periplasmic adaptor subunit [Aureliella helgolandensis]|uniref:Putative efflux pump membrane fusion protein n=1 Tax=Aureliella helgolandensis TaxID=2527968 RepID=A0A518FZD9_9BACT|nr:HlyD family efflux transporter periplasmic adaptor subunit [Aureliella helgolandensis]QDV21729.1 putative efflux pump membrane fusion protein [Aureliella helgolandensis]